MLYVELSKRFHELGALHEDDEDLVLHERYHKKGIFYEMKHREAVASNYIEGIYQVIRGIEEDVYLQVMQIQLQEVQEDLKEIDEHYKNIWSKIK